MWRFVFTYDRGRFEWEYKFNPLPGIPIEGRHLTSEADTKLKLLAPPSSEVGERKNPRRVVADTEFTQIQHDGEPVEMIGPVVGEFYAFDRDRPVLNIMPEATSLTEFLDENGGVRVYRDGVRVYNYGERADR